MEKVKDKFKAKCYNVNIGYIDIKYLSIKWGINSMKQIIFIFCMILMLSFCGCTNVGSNRNEYMSNWFKSEQEISDKKLRNENWKQKKDMFWRILEKKESYLNQMES
mgnify:CR=1 FL=1